MEESLSIQISYSVEPGRLPAGEHPGAHDPAATIAWLQWFRTSEVERFVDLTEPFEVEPYAHLLDGAGHERRPMPDFGTTQTAAYRKTLDVVDEALEAGVRVYEGWRHGD